MQDGSFTTSTPKKVPPKDAHYESPESGHPNKG